MFFRLVVESNRLKTDFYFVFSSIALFQFALVGLSGCGSSERLTGRVGLLEKRIRDLQRDQIKLVERIDEMEIRILLHSKKQTSGVSADISKNLSNGTRYTPTDIQKTQPRQNRPKSRKDKPASSYQKIISELGPELVREKLPPDPRKERLSSAQNAGLTFEAKQDMAQAEFDRASEFYESSKHKQVVAILTEWIRYYDDHHLAPDARYLLGSSRIALEEFDAAQNDLIALATRHPKSQNAPQALLMASQCQERLGRFRQARNTYLQLVESYPLSKEAADANQRLKALR